MSAHACPKHSHWGNWWRRPTPSNISPRMTSWLRLQRHVAGDWGEVCAEDKQSNDHALVEGTRILSAYRAADGTKFWIITEADRSVTTVLLPEDY